MYTYILCIYIYMMYICISYVSIYTVYFIDLKLATRHGFSGWTATGFQSRLSPQLSQVRGKGTDGDAQRGADGSHHELEMNLTW